MASAARTAGLWATEGRASQQRVFLRVMLFRSTSARHRIRHGIRHTAADALQAAGVDGGHVYHDFASGVRDDRQGLDSCVRALRTGDVLVVWKLDRLGRNLVHLVNTVQDLSTRGVGLRVLTGQGAPIDTTTAPGRLVFGIFAALAEFERELIRERTLAGLTAARARGRKGGRTFALSKAQVRLAQAAMAHRDTSVSALCRELGITPVTLYRYVGPQGQLREQGEKVLAT